MIFHAAIGNVSDRVERIAEISEEIIKLIDNSKKEDVIKAAKLCKADLATGMVGEFPELQGIMGYYYTLEMGEKKQIAEAIKNHYSPLGPNDKVPQGSVSISLALAEKIEAIVSLFAAGERATGSKDPFALRRLALGIIRIISENRLNLDLKPIFKKSLKLLPSQALKNLNKENLIEELSDFVCERIKNQLKAENFAPNIIDIILNRSGEININELKDKIMILSQYSSSEYGFAAIECFKRSLNILKIEEKREGVTYSPKPSSSLLVENVEKSLYKALEDVESDIKTALKEGDFKFALQVLTKLPNFVNNFFDNTMINVTDRKLRENRLKLSASIVEIFNKVADFEGF
jgi:glycyl-tRNA synthetase beta chain